MHRQRAFDPGVAFTFGVLLCVVAAAFFLAACDSAPGHDAAVTLDLSANGIGCAGILTCVESCSTAGCVQTCSSMGSADAQTAFAALYACSTAQCGAVDLGVTDGGTGFCTGPADTSHDCAECVKAAVPSSVCESQLVTCEGTH